MLTMLDCRASYYSYYKNFRNKLRFILVKGVLEILVCQSKFRTAYLSKQNPPLRGSPPRSGISISYVSDCTMGNPYNIRIFSSDIL